MQKIQKTKDAATLSKMNMRVGSYAEDSNNKSYIGYNYFTEGGSTVHAEMDVLIKILNKYKLLSVIRWIANKVKKESLGLQIMRRQKKGL
jgi:cytidine deaminase